MTNSGKKTKKDLINYTKKLNIHPMVSINLNLNFNNTVTDFWITGLLYDKIIDEL